MTDGDWSGCVDPVPMLQFLGGKASERKLRFLACACCRRVWHLLPAGPCRKAVELAELYANGKATAEQLEAAQLAVRRVRRGLNDKAAALASLVLAPRANPAALARAAAYTVWATTRTAAVELWDEEWRWQAALVRDCFGDPPRPVLIDSSWLTWHGNTVVKLAQGIYDERAFDRLPILADALEEAGCADAGILSHCRGPGSHVPGCWLVDLLLGKG